MGRTEHPFFQRAEDFICQHTSNPFHILEFVIICCPHEACRPLYYHSIVMWALEKLPLSPIKSAPTFEQASQGSLVNVKVENISLQGNVCLLSRQQQACGELSPACLSLIFPFPQHCSEASVIPEHITAPLSPFLCTGQLSLYCPPELLLVLQLSVEKSSFTSPSCTRQNETLAHYKVFYPSCCSLVPIKCLYQSPYPTGQCLSVLCCLRQTVSSRSQQLG